MSTKVLFVMLDGCRPDALTQAHTPTLNRLWQTGAYTWTARSVMPSVTLPAHNSIFRSVTPDKHGVGEDNIFRASALDFPSVIDLASLHNKHCVMYFSWEQLRDLSAPGSLKMSWCRAANYGGDNDTAVALAAADYLTAEQPDFCFLYFGDIDIAGHMFGWMSREYLAALEANDRALGLVLERLEHAGLRDQYTLIVQADHGGHDNGHGTDMSEDMTIPWIINGRGVKQNHAIQSSVGLCDTAATIAHLLEIPRPDVWQGQPVLEALK